ncbi:hypothetical protein N9F58_00240 [Akkermansiaceae bacterium]|nr:hypothetical protein [Akkermansiaceae bacterium]
MKIKSVWSRFKDDLLPKNIFENYVKQLEYLQDKGFSMISLYEAFQKLPTLNGIVAIRHDIDVNDISGNRAFFEIEKRFGATATYYFRLETLDHHLPLIKDLQAENFEIGYHFEEPATFMKESNIKSLHDLKNHTVEINNLISSNIKKVEERIENNIYSLCSHGDWINRKYKFSNYDFLDREFLNKNELCFEAYQDNFLNAFSIYITDTSPVGEVWVDDIDAIRALEQGHKNIYMLTHERTFHTNIRAAWESNLVVLGERLKHKFYKYLI